MKMCTMTQYVIIIIILHVIHLKACWTNRAASSIYSNCQFALGPNCSNNISEIFFFLLAHNS